AAPHTYLARARRNDHRLLGTTLTQPLVEPDDDGAAQIGHDTERCRLGRNHLRRKLVALAAGRGAVLGAAGQRERRDDGATDSHVSAFSLSPRRSSCSRNDAAFSRSRATTSAGARATNASLTSLLSVPRS